MGAGEYRESINAGVESRCCRCWTKQKRLLDDCIRVNRHIGVSSWHYPRFSRWFERRETVGDVCGRGSSRGRFPMERCEAIGEECCVIG